MDWIVKRKTKLDQKFKKNDETTTQKSKKCVNKNDLIVTLDLGNTWKKLAQDVVEFSWYVFYIFK